MSTAARFFRWPPRWIPILATPLLVIALSAIVIVGGHGGGNASIILLRGTAPEWRIVQVCSWLGAIALPASSILRSRRAYLAGALCGLAFLASAWFVLLTETEATFVTFITSVPFLVLLALAAFLLIRAREPHDEPTSRRGFPVVPLQRGGK